MSKCYDEPTIFDLWHKVQQHPDYVFGTLFVRGDIPEGHKLPDNWNPKYVEETLAQDGNEMILNESVPA